MKLSRFCAKCGKKLDTEESMNPEFLCNSCIQNIPIEIPLPLSISIQKCNQCSAISLIKEDQEFDWIFQPEGESILDFLTRLLYENIFFKLEKKYDFNYELFLPASLDLQSSQDLSLLVQVKPPSVTYKIQKSITISIKNRMCPHCSKRIGGRFDATIQIRVFDPEDKSKLDILMDYIFNLNEEFQMKNTSNFISKIEKTTNGFDLKISNNVAFKAFVSNLRSKFPLQLKFSKTLYGVDKSSGATLYRNNILLRILPVDKGQYLQIDSKFYLVKGFQQNRVTLQDLTTNKNKQFPFTIFEKKKYQKYDVNPLSD